MKEPYEKGLATHLDPEPCVGVREDVGEASVGADAGWVSSREIAELSGADAVTLCGRQQRSCRYCEDRPSRRGLRPQHVSKLSAREPGDPVAGHDGVARVLNPTGILER